MAAQWKCILFDKSTGRFRALQKVGNRIHYGASSTSLEVAVQAAIAKFKKTREELWQGAAPVPPGADASEASEPLEEPSAELAMRPICAPRLQDLCPTCHSLRQGGHGR